MTVTGDRTPTTSPAPAPAPVRIRRLPCPVAEPPFDDEIGRRPTPPGLSPAASSPAVLSPAVQGTLALAFVLPSGVPAEPDPPTTLRIVGGDGAMAAASDTDLSFVDRQPTSAQRLPEPRRWAARLAQAIMETLHGHRPVQQLLRWTNDAVYTAITGRLAARPRSGLRARPTVRSIRVCTPTDGVAEASVVVQSGNRCRALALRLEGLDGQWRCTALELI